MSTVITAGLTVRKCDSPAAEAIVAAPADGKSGDVYNAIANGKPGVAAGAGNEYKSGDQIGVYTKGLFEGPAVSGDTWSDGDDVYWSVANKNLTSTAAGNFVVGKAHGAKTAGQTFAFVRLD